MEIDLKDLFFALLKKWYWLLLGLALGAGLGYFSYTRDAAPTYQATAQLEVFAEYEPTVNGSNPNNDIAKLNYEHALIATVLDVINSDRNLDRVAASVADIYADENSRLAGLGQQAYDVPQVGRADIRAAVKAAGGGESKTLFITVTVTASSPDKAIAYINAYVEEAIEVTQGLKHKMTLQAADVLPSFENMANDVTVTEPSARRSLLVGGVIGVALCAVIVLLAFGMDKRVKSEAEVADRFGLPVLAVLPEINGRRDK